MQPTLCLVTEFARYGSLSDLLLRTDLQVPLDALLTMAQQIGACQSSIGASAKPHPRQLTPCSTPSVDAMACLHEHEPPILHRDLNGNNVLVYACEPEHIDVRIAGAGRVAGAGGPFPTPVPTRRPPLALAQTLAWPSKWSATRRSRTRRSWAAPPSSRRRCCATTPATTPRCAASHTHAHTGSARQQGADPVAACAGGRVQLRGDAVDGGAVPVRQ